MNACSKGHPLTDDNVYVVFDRTRQREWRRCRQCALDYQHAHRSRRIGRPPKNPQLRILDHVRIDSSGCWIWQSTISPKGYAQIGVREGERVRSKIAHRYAYEAFVGPIPEGLELDHLCFVPSCVNPAHLEPVTHEENQKRAQARWSVVGRDSAA